jgi:hypothetical protein
MVQRTGVGIMTVSPSMPTGIWGALTARQRCGLSVIT